MVGWNHSTTTRHTSLKNSLNIKHYTPNNNTYSMILPPKSHPFTYTTFISLSHYIIKACISLSLKAISLNQAYWIHWIKSSTHLSYTTGTTAFNSMSSQTIRLGLSIFQCGSKKSVHGWPSREFAPYDRKTERMKDCYLVKESDKWMSSSASFLYTIYWRMSSTTQRCLTLVRVFLTVKCDR